MTYTQFIAIVNENLPIESARRGLEDFRARMMKNALVDLQRYIVSYRVGHSTTYQEVDLQAEEHGMLGNLPANAVPTAFYIVDTADGNDGEPHPQCKRNRLDFWDWENRRALFCNSCDLRRYAYALDPFGRMFAIHPAINDETELLLIWNGIKSAFTGVDVVPFPEEAAEAVAAYVKWRILLEVDKNPALAQVEYGIWTQKRLALYRDEQEKQDAGKPDAEFTAADAPAAPANNF